MAEAEIGHIPSVPKPELVYDENYRHAITASTYINQRSLLTNVGDRALFTEYYRQYLGKDEQPVTIQPESIQTYQSYTKIKGLIMKLDSATSDSFDDENGIMTRVGVGYVLIELAPMIGDVFICDIADGRTGLFTISSAPRITRITNDKVYEVDFRLLAFMTKELELNLTEKTVKELVYSKDSAVRGGNAVITTNDFKSNNELNQFETLISQHVMEHFYFNPEKTIVLPSENEEDEIVYDPYLTRFLQYTIATRRLGMRDNIRVVGTEVGRMDRGGKKINVWDMFLKGEFNHPKVFKQSFFIHKSISLLNTKYYGGIYYSKIDKAILTEEEGASKAAYRGTGSLMFGDYDRTGAGNSPSSGDPYTYYFSDEFYTGSPTKPTEKFIFDMFRDKVIDKKALLKVLEGYWDLDPIDQLYLSGIYLMAIRQSLSTTYNYF